MHEGGSGTPRWLIPGLDGGLFSGEWKDALWARFSPAYWPFDAVENLAVRRARISIGTCAHRRGLSPIHRGRPRWLSNVDAALA